MANGEAYEDQGSGRQFESRESAREAMWEKHLQSPVSALDETLTRTAAGGERAESATAGGSTLFEASKAPSLFLW